MSEEPAIVTLRECMVLVQTGMNTVMGINRGRRGELSPITAGIVYLSDARRIRMGDIAKIFGISKSTATGYIDNLEKMGYVRRKQGEDDRRDIYIVPAQQGEQWILETEKRVFALLNDWLERLLPEERMQFIGYLSKFTGYAGSDGHEDAVPGVIVDHLHRVDSGADTGDGSPGRFETMVRREYAWDTGTWLEE